MGDAERSGPDEPGQAGAGEAGAGAPADGGLGPLLLVGPAGSGRTERLARRHAELVRSGEPSERILVLAHSRAGRARLRQRVESLLGGVHGELWVLTVEELATRLLRELALDADLDPFFATVSATDRLAMLLDELDELPLRRHAIRGNPAGLLARLVARIDALKREGVPPSRLRELARLAERAADGVEGRERARREGEFADLFEHHDRIVRDSGSLDGADRLAALARLLGERPDLRRDLAERFGQLLVDEVEDLGALELELVLQLAGDGSGLVCACDPSGAIRGPDGAAPALAALESRFGSLRRLELGDSLRKPGELRFWRCLGERAQADAVARELEHLLATGSTVAERICVIAGSGWREARLVAAALEERNVPYRYVGDAAFFGRPEVRDVLAWLRMLADPSDAPAAVRALTRPPVELRSADLARVTMIARRRKVDIVAAVAAALESPQLRPEARDRLQAFLKLHRAAEAAMERMRADVFVRRLVERIGLRRHRLFAASPEAAERLVNLSRLADMAADWSRREPRRSSRDFVRHLSAVAEAGELGSSDCEPPAAGGVVLADPEQVKGLEFEAVYLLGLRSGALSSPAWRDAWVSPAMRGRLSAAEPAAGEDPARAAEAARRERLATIAMSRATGSLVLSWPQAGSESPSHLYSEPLEALGVRAEEEVHEEELFGPAEGLHSTYRMIRDEVLEASWRAGGALSEMRLDTAHDVDRAVARFLELIKLAALVQRPGAESAPEALAAINELLGRVATGEQRAVLATSALDEYVAEEERERSARRAAVSRRHEPSLEQFIPRSGEGVALSASDIGLYRTCPLKYKFARVFAIPQEPTINQRFGILLHTVLERFHAEQLRAGPGELAPEPGAAGEVARAAGLERLLGLFEAGWRRSGFGSSDDELQYRDRGVAALTRYAERLAAEPRRPVWVERRFSFVIDRHTLRGRVDRVDRAPGGGYELIDYKTGRAPSPSELAEDVQLALYRVAAREAWHVDAELGSYWYVLADQRVPAPAEPDDAERVERTVLEVAAGIEGQDFEPRPSHEICSWCDYRLICPASEA